MGKRASQSGKPKGGDLLFGWIAVERGLVPAEKLKEALAEKSRRDATGEKVTVGQILVERGQLTEDQVRTILLQQVKTVMACRDCGAKFNVSLRIGAKARCLKCGGELSPLDRGAPPVVEPEEILDSPAQPRTLEGTRLGKYRVGPRIGFGAMGEVYKGEHADLGRQVAIKVIHPALGGGPMVDRFLSEARMAAKLVHPCIAQVFDVGVEKGTHYLVMEYVPGITLEEAVEGRLPVEERKAAAYIARIADALGYAHREGIIHRDVKPSNVLVTRDALKLVDFGLARAVTGGKNLTQFGEVTGTPTFMSPEQCTGGKLDGRTDLYSLAVLHYWLVTGVYPFDGATQVDVMYAQVHRKPDPPTKHNPRLKTELQTLLLWMLAKDSDARPRNAEAVIRVLRDIYGRPAPVRAPLPPRPGKERSKLPTSIASLPAISPKKKPKAEAAPAAPSEDPFELTVHDDERKCPRCRAIIPKTAPGCAECGLLLCTGCGTPKEADDAFCGACGKQLGKPPTRRGMGKLAQGLASVVRKVASGRPAERPLCPSCGKKPLDARHACPACKERFSSCCLRRVAPDRAHCTACGLPLRLYPA